MTSATLDRILRFREVCWMIGLSRTTLWRKVRDGEFPAPVRLGANSIGWRRSAVEGWLSDREQN